MGAGATAELHEALFELLLAPVIVLISLQTFPHRFYIWNCSQSQKAEWKMAVGIFLVSVQQCIFFPTLCSSEACLLRTDIAPDTSWKWVMLIFLFVWTEEDTMEAALTRWVWHLWLLISMVLPMALAVQLWDFLILFFLIICVTNSLFDYFSNCYVFCPQVLYGHQSKLQCSSFCCVNSTRARVTFSSLYSSLG